MVVWSKNMKIKFEVELDTENEQDIDLVEELLDYVNDFKEMLERPQQNLNKHSNNNNKKKAQR